jgi:hypothetical protein
MTYVIKNYSEDFLEKQVEIGTIMLENWSGAGQTNVKGLKQRYAMDDFDPETKLYAFKDDELIGFLTATIKVKKEDEEILRANMEFPIVLEGHKDVEKLLMEKAISVLKSKGVGRVQSRGSEQWGNTMDMVKEYEYTQKRIVSRSGEIELSNIESEKRELNVEDYNEEKHLEMVKKMYIEKMKMPEQQLERQLEYIKNNPDEIISWNVYIENNKVVGNSIIAKSGEKDGFFSSIAAYGSDSKLIRKNIFSKNIEVGKSKGLEKLLVFLAGDALELKQDYTDLKVKFNPDIILYHKDI